MKGSTKSAHLGRPHGGNCTINPPISSGSTVLFPDYATFRDRKQAFHYGRLGTQTHWALQENLLSLEGATGVALTPSGVSALSTAIISFVGQGGHVLCTDSAYDPTRTMCHNLLGRMGISTTFYDPTIGGGIASLIQPNTQLIICETPGSLTFEIQDIPAIVAAAKDIPVLVDNTYGAGVHFRPLELGATVSLQALTKYVGGHSDFLMGAIFTKEDTATRKVAAAIRDLGMSVSGQDVALAHRGLRTLHRRLAVHEENGLALARWLEARPEVRKVIHPGLPSHPQHDLWARDSHGTNGLFSALIAWEDDSKTERFMNALTLFGLGYSWGGFESLCMPAWPQGARTAVPWTESGQLLRFHVGLEEIADLTADLEQAFDAAEDKRGH